MRSLLHEFVTEISFKPAHFASSFRLDQVGHHVESVTVRLDRKSLSTRFGFHPQVAEVVKAKDLAVGQLGSIGLVHSYQLARVQPARRVQVAKCIQRERTLFDVGFQTEEAENNVSQELFDRGERGRRNAVFLKDLMQTGSRLSVAHIESKACGKWEESGKDLF